jgi:uncharacterized protein (TIGR03382 family)
MHAPKVAWSLSVGALLGAPESLVADIDGDGRPEVTVLSGGRVVVSRPDGTTLWKSALLGPRALLGAWDLDGSGPIEVVVDTASGVRILAGSDGHEVASLATTAAVSATFAPETPKGGVLVLAASRGPLSGYDFRGGVASIAPAWTITGANQSTDVVDDVDGDGIPDLVRPLEDGFEIDDPLTGATKYALPGMGPYAYFYGYSLANVDGKPGDEIVAVDTSYVYSPDCGIYVLGVQAGALKTLWSVTLTPTLALGADFWSVAGATSDLDGDGSVEQVYAQWDDTAQQWTTVIADAVTGTTLGTMPGAFLEAVGDVDGDGKRDIVTRAGVLGNQTPARSTLSAWDFASRQTGPVAKSWTLPNAHVMTSASRPPLAGAMFVPVVEDFDSSVPGFELLVGMDPSGQADADARLATVHGANGTTAATYAPPATVHPSVVAPTAKATARGSANDVILSQDDGTVHVLDRSLHSRVSLAAGTYANWLSAYAGGPGQPNLFAATANDHLEWIDGRHLHADGTPYVRFDEPGVVSTYPMAQQSYPLDPVVFLSGQSPSLVTYEQGPTSVSIVAHDTLGVEQWRTMLAAGTQVYSPGSYAIDLTGDGNDDLLACLVDIYSRESLAIFDAKSGTLVRSTPITTVKENSDFASTGALTDVNGDGKLDLVVPVNTWQSVFAVDLTQQPFALLWFAQQPGTAPAYNGTVTVAPVGAAKTPSLLRTNGHNALGPYEKISLAGSIVAAGDQGLPVLKAGDDRNAAVAVATGPGSFDLVSAGTADVGLSRVRRIAGDTMATVWTVYAAGGAIASSAPAAGFALHDPVVLDVDGNGVDDVVFGSDDGYLYAVSSADGSLVFAVNLGSPVAHVVAANVDLDPALEIVAALTDGHVVALDDHYDAVQDAPDGGAVVDAGTRGGDAGCGGDAGADCSEGGGGGCGCGAAGEAGAPAGAVLALACLGAALVRRRKP